MNDKIIEVIEELIRDIRSRNGLRDMWDSIDESIQDEIKAEWYDIILNTYNL